MVAIKTFVFFDLETSGLPQFSPVKITEISLVAAGREHMLEKHDGVSKENNFGNFFLPRVLNKINLTVYPCKLIHPGASTISGLTNENLEKQKPFDEGMFNILELFLERLEKPVCLVAHNGNKFDFPILKSELTRIGKELPEDIFCADSLLGFRDVLAPQPNNEDQSNHQSNVFNDIKPLDTTTTNTTADFLPKCGWSNEDYDNELIKVTEVAEKITREYDEIDMVEAERKIKLEMEQYRKMNETTPIRKPKHTSATPMNEHVRRKILNGSRQPKPKFNMSALYERLTKKELVNAHCAEADALALLECVTAVGLPIMEWMDSNRIPFRSIKKMW